MGETERLTREAGTATANSCEAPLFDCNICMDAASEPVVTLCGHLYCWPCIYKWLQLRDYSQTCPVCKTCISKTTMIPIYGRGRPQVDPRIRKMPLDTIPTRPPGQRPVTERRHALDAASQFELDPGAALPFDHSLRQYSRQQPGGATSSPSLSAGLSFFPSLLGLHLVTPPHHPDHDDAVISAEQAQQIFLSRMLLLLGCFVILCLLLF